MKYNYDSDKEAFVREDGLGKKFYINSHEAQRIVTLRELGYTVPEIKNKINFNSNKVYESSIENFLKNVYNGDIIVSSDYPAPKQVMRDLTVEEKYNELEERVNELEARMDNIQQCYCNDELTKESKVSKVKSWLKI